MQTIPTRQTGWTLYIVGLLLAIVVASVVLVVIDDDDPEACEVVVDGFCS